MSLKIYNTLTRTKEIFEPINPGYVGMYVCGPTVYSDVHLGNCRTFMSFDMIYRYLLHLGFKVRYVRNITDAGHLEGDRDEGDDKFSKKARLEQLEPMEIVQRYTVGFRDVMRQLNNLPPTIEPTATGHITEQIEMTKQLLANGYAYETDGTIYFDVEKYDKEKPYGILTNRKLDELLEGTRDLGGQEEKKGRLDFALWIKAKPEHLMQWPSPWGMGFPGWHIECSAMSAKYLGKEFDIHGGGMDLAATHHTNEIAQSQACNHTSPARVWMHTNMLTVNGVRMSKSAGNGFLPGELFTGDHPLLERGYHPMVVRFFMLQTHYRSTLDFSNEALQGSEKALKRLWNAYDNLMQLSSTNPTATDLDLEQQINTFLDAFDIDMNDDFNTAKVIANMFEITGTINSIKDGIIKVEALSNNTLLRLQSYFKNFLENVFGLQSINEADDSRLDAAMQVLIELRKTARAKKDFVTSDAIRNQLAAVGIQLKDEKGGEMSWE
jgi:cysteinyl-tRNA synthetase